MDLARLAGDPSLTPDAFRLLAYVASLGDGEHEVRQHTLKGLLRCRSDEPIYEAREVAAEHGLMWKRGGRAHGTVYWFTLGRESSDDSRPTLNQAQDDSRPVLNQTNRFTPDAESNAAVVVGGVVVTDKQQEQRAREASYPLSDRAIVVLAENDDGFAGFRGALRDYLVSRVNPPRQYGYLQSLATWLQGGDASVFRLSDGSRAPDAEIPGMVAGALNELLAIDEAAMKWPVGDIRNLKTKLAILCRQRSDHARPPPRGDPATNGIKPPLTKPQFDEWLRLREAAEKRGMDPEAAARDTYEEARRSA